MSAIGFDDQALLDAVEEDEAPDPGDVRLLGAAAHMAGPQGLTDAI